MTLDPRARTLTLSAADLPSLAGADGLAATFVKLDAGSSGEAASSVRTIALPPTPKLTELQLWRFPELRELSLDAPRLTIFQAYGVPLLERVSPLPRLRSLQASCSLAVFAGSLAAVREIHQIHVDEAARPALGELEAVTHFVCVTPLERLDFFPALPRLKSLGVVGPNLRTLDGVETLGSITNLTIRSGALTDISAIAGLSKLKEVSFAGCSSLRDVGPLASFGRLRQVNLEHTKVRPSDVPLSLVPARSPSGIHPQALRRKVEALAKQARAASTSGG
ncbi:MAG: hypothetical protein KC619_36010 [Myxococcales bacterium]|nr:hypothetical protein [Myxococcales bacterium]